MKNTRSVKNIKSTLENYLSLIFFNQYITVFVDFLLNSQERFLNAAIVDDVISAFS